MEALYWPIACTSITSFCAWCAYRWGLSVGHWRGWEKCRRLQGSVWPIQPGMEIESDLE